MKLSDKEALNYAKKYSKDWDYFIICADAFSAGVKFAIENKETLNQQVLYDPKNGEHQLSEATFRKWKFEKAIEEVNKVHYKTLKNLKD